MAHTSYCKRHSYRYYGNECQYCQDERLERLARRQRPADVKPPVAQPGQGRKRITNGDKS